MIMELSPLTCEPQDAVALEGAQLGQARQRPQRGVWDLPGAAAPAVGDPSVRWRSDGAQPMAPNTRGPCLRECCYPVNDVIRLCPGRVLV